MGRIQLAFELKNMGVYVSWLTLNTCHNRLQKEHIIWAVPSTFPEISGSRTLLWPLQLNNIARDPVSQEEKSTKFAQLMEAILRTYPETTRSSPIRSNQIQSGSIIEVPGPTLLFSLSKAVHRESPWWTMFGWQLGGFCCQLGRFPVIICFGIKMAQSSGSFIADAQSACSGNLDISCPTLMLPAICGWHSEGIANRWIDEHIM